MSSSITYADKFPGVQESKCYLAPNIPNDKLAAALASYGNNTTPNDVIMLIDDTVWGSSTEGLLLTRDVLYYKEIYQNGGSYRLNGFQIKPQKGFLKTFLIDGHGNKFISLTQISFSSVAVVCAYINQLSEGAFDSIDEVTQSTSATSGEKICPFCGETIKMVAIKCRFCGEMLPKSNSCHPAANSGNNKNSNSECNQFLFVWQSFIDDFDIEKASHKLESFSPAEMTQAVDELEKRMEHEDYDAGAILVAMNIFGATFDDLEPEQLQQLGGVLGLCVANNHARSIQLLQRINRIKNEGSVDYRIKNKLQIFLRSVSSQCNIDQYL